MRPTFLAFQTAGRAMAASQANIDVTGNNIANVNTQGYTRQRVDLSSISESGYTQKYITSTVTSGYGVTVSGISQIRDPFLDARYRNEASENGMYDTILSGLRDLEYVFDEIEAVGLKSELNNFINQLQTLSQTPTSNDISAIVRTGAQKLTQIINVYAQQIDQVRQQQIYDLNNVVIENDFNSMVKSIAELNTQIRDELTHGNIPNELYDKRNSLLDQLSEIANIKITVTPEALSESLIIENMSLSIYDAGTGTSIPILENGLYNTLSVKQGASGKVEIHINRSFDQGHDKNITGFITGGSIKAYLDLINGNGSFSQGGENSFRGTLFYQNAMDNFASNLAHILNELNTDADGNNKPLFAASDGSIQITAANICIHDDWLKDTSYLITTRDTDFPGEGDNVLRMIDALSSKQCFYRDLDDPDSQIMFEGSFNEYLTGLIGGLALDIDLNNNFLETSTAVLSNIYGLRESISGVSLNEEGINMMAYQKSFQAAARYFTVLDEAVDILINKMGIVGR